MIDSKLLKRQDHRNKKLKIKFSKNLNNKSKKGGNKLNIINNLEDNIINSNMIFK
jgi:hypothetical protein